MQPAKSMLFTHKINLVSHIGKDATYRTARNNHPPADALPTCRFPEYK